MFEILKIVIALFVLGYAFHQVLRYRPSLALCLLFLLLFSRFVLAALHQYSYTSIIGSYSLISLASMASVGVCFVLLPIVKPRGRPQVVISKSLILIYCLIALMLVSGVANGNIKVGFSSLIKWIYLLQLVTLFGFVISMDGLRKTLRFIIIAYSYPVIMLLSSIVLGESKRAEFDGSTSYVGGFFHEAVFSTIIFSAAFFFLMYLKNFSRYRDFSFYILLSAFFVMMIFINYRTTIIAFAAMAAILMFSSFIRAKLIYRVLLTLGLIIIVLLSGSLNFESFGTRFQDLPNALDNASDLITTPENYSRDERKLFSGRILIWSEYISLANEGSTLQILIGRGMGAWEEFFTRYAHNTFISFYFELGFIGLILCAAIFFGIYRRLRKIKVVEVRTCGMAFLFGFMVLNLGTMPMWSMEGIYCMAFLIALAKASITFNRHSAPRVAYV